jgi:ParB-like chromosome segregation protein Spo0J
MEQLKRKLTDLKPHPKNEEIYGSNEDVSDLIVKIQKSGKVSTFTITKNNVIIAGHRRRKACMQLGIKEVNVEIMDFDSPEDEVEWLILDNATREKTVEQKGREAKTLLEVEKVKAEKRLSELGATGGRGKKGMAELPQGFEKGLSRDLTAQKVGLKSGREVERAIKTVEIIDGLKEDGKDEEAELIRGVLNNRSVSIAEELAKNIDNVVIPDEEKELIKTGKKSAYSYVEKAKQKLQPQEETKVCKVCGKELSLYNFYDGKNTCKNCCAEEDRKRKENSRVFRDASGNELKIDHELLKGVDMNAIIESIKGDVNRNPEINYELEYELFKSNVDDFIFANNKFIKNNELYNGMSNDLQLMFKNEVNKLSNAVEQLKNIIK